MTLPQIFATNMQNIPSGVPYLSVDPTWGMASVPPASSSVAGPPAETGRCRDGLRVGIAWAGNPGHKNDRNRSIPFATFAPLLATKGIEWFSLQVGERAADLAQAPAGLLTDLADRFTDFADTAMAVARLDLLIAVDTAIAHLAGALGKPAWVLLPFVADWRWFLDRIDSPWYPSLRLFRQTAPGDWTPVVSAVQRELEKLGRQSMLGRRTRRVFEGVGA
jgi:hypothetical protein